MIGDYSNDEWINYVLTNPALYLSYILSHQEEIIDRFKNNLEDFLRFTNNKYNK